MPGVRRVFGGNADGFLSHDAVLDLEIVRIHAGGYCITDGAAVLSTLLGSCIAVCMRDVDSGISGMNHFLVPGTASTPSDSDRSEDCRYGATAIDALLRGMKLMGARQSTIQTKLFGGAEMLSQMRPVGHYNIAFAEDYLDQLGIAVVSRDVGGTEHRVIRFHTADGRVQVQRGRKAGPNAAAALTQVSGHADKQMERREP